MLHTLRLRDFRCYKRLNWDIPPEGALLIGANAQGKTSLIEAICVALTLHSPRRSRFRHLAGYGFRHAPPRLAAAPLGNAGE